MQKIHELLKPTLRTQGSKMVSPQIQKRNDIWRCPQCDNEIILHIRVNEPPLCSNKKAHSRKSHSMAKFKPNRKQI